MLRETGNHVALPRPLSDRAAGRCRKLHMSDSYFASRAGRAKRLLPREKNRGGEEKIQVAIINSCVRFLPGARPSLFPTKKKWSPTFSIPSFLLSLFVSFSPPPPLLPPVFLSFSSPRPFPRSYSRPLVCVDYDDGRRCGFQAQWSVSLLLRASAGACTLRKSHPSCAVCEEIFSRLCERENISLLFI